LAFQDLVIGGVMDAEPVVTEGEGVEEFPDNGLLVCVGGDHVLTPQGVGGGLIVGAVKLAAVVDEAEDKLLAGIDIGGVVAVAGGAAADVEDVGDLVAGVEGIGVGFAGDGFGEGLAEGARADS
jgi:hypothetical protein